MPDPIIYFALGSLACAAGLLAGYVCEAIAARLTPKEKKISQST